LSRRRQARWAALVAVWSFALEADAVDAPPLPPAALIQGVPYFGWHEAVAWQYPNRDVVNPAAMAAGQSMYRYWGLDVLRAAEGGTSAFTTEGGAGTSLEDVKRVLARGWPVMLDRATTARAHRLYVVPKMCAAMKHLDLVGPTRASGTLGDMVPLEEIARLRAAGCEVGLNDSVIVAPQVAVGYDDARRVFVVHDPSLGPHLEVAYDDLERAWSATGRMYAYLAPVDPAASRPIPVAVRARTADDDAAVALFAGYAAAVCDDNASAADILRRALALPGISPARTHLLRLELGTALYVLNDVPAAIAELRGANAAFDEYAHAHDALAAILAASDDAAERRASKAEKKRAKSLCSPAAQRRVADTLGRDFYVMGCGGELLGWYRP
jgi:hypothetical protein